MPLHVVVGLAPTRLFTLSGYLPGNLPGYIQGGPQMKAVVMAGGEGSRLRPLTIRRPKPMVPIVGKPVMEHILNLLKRHGITEVVVKIGRAHV